MSSNKRLLNPPRLCCRCHSSFRLVIALVMSLWLLAVWSLVLHNKPVFFHFDSEDVGSDNDVVSGDVAGQVGNNKLNVCWISFCYSQIDYYFCFVASTGAFKHMKSLD